MKYTPMTLNGVTGYLYGKECVERLKQLASTATNAAELGTWYGCSAVVQALEMPEGAKLTCVDTFQSSSAELDGSSTLEIFTGHLDRLRLRDRVNVVVGDCHEPAIQAQVPDKLDYIFIDASHETEDVYQDIRLYAPKLKPDGVMLVHDLDWASVKAGIDRAVADGLVTFEKAVGRDTAELKPVPQVPPTEKPKKTRKKAVK